MRTTSALKSAAEEESEVEPRGQDSLRSGGVLGEYA